VGLLGGDHPALHAGQRGAEDRAARELADQLDALVEGLQQIAEQFSLSALDGAACELGVTRETLARALATPESRERFTPRYGIDDAELARAIRAGLLRAVDDAEEAGALTPFIGVPLRETLRRIPVDEAIDLIQNARSLLDNAQSFLGPAQGLLEQFLP
jgi:hypothetical protein